MATKEELRRLRAELNAELDKRDMERYGRIRKPTELEPVEYRDFHAEDEAYTGRMRQPRHRKKREKVVKALGGRCQWCGVSDGYEKEFRRRVKNPWESDRYYKTQWLVFTLTDEAKARYQATGNSLVYLLARELEAGRKIEGVILRCRSCVHRLRS